MQPGQTFPLRWHGKSRPLDTDAASRFEPSALDAIFEQGRGLPALLTACAEECLTAQPKGPISAEQVAAVLDRIASTMRSLSMPAAQPTLNDLSADAFARYLVVRPAGIQFPHGRLCPSLSAAILACRPARTLYQNKQPVCRSLDGIQSLQESLSAVPGTAQAGRACASCLLRKSCTPQIYLELLAANSSAPVAKSSYPLSPQ